MIKVLNLLGYSDLSNGPATNTLTFHKYLCNSGHKSKLIVNSSKKKTTSIGHPEIFDDDTVEFLNVFENIPKVLEMAKEYELVIFHTMPWPFQGGIVFNDQDKQNFIGMIKSLKDMGKKLVYYEYAHDEAHAVKKYNFLLNDPANVHVYNLFDATIAYNSSTTVGIGKIYDKLGIKQKHGIISIDNGLANTIAINMDEIRQKYWKPYSEKINDTIHFLGRPCPYKGIWKFRDLHHSHFKKAGFISIIEGVIYSIGTLEDLYSQIKPVKIPREDVFLVPTKKAELAKYYSGEIPLEKNQPAYIFPAYVNSEGIDRMSKSMFGISLLLWKDKYLRETFENAMLEIISAGDIPVFRKTWAQNFCINGTSLYDLGTEKTGMIYIDEEHPDEAIAQMQAIAKDQKLYDQTRETCFRFFNENLGMDAVYSKVADALENMEARYSKSEDDLFAL